MENSMWTDTTRAHHARCGLALPSDLTDAEWALIEPHIPSRSQLGRPALWSLQRIVEALLYLLRGGLPWRMLPPKTFPPATTVQHYFYRWRDAGIWPSINHALVMAAREQAGCEGSPTAGVFDRQSVKTTESGGIRGFDAGKKLVGRKRHIVTETQGFMAGAVIHAASVQDRDGAPGVLAAIRQRYPWLRHIFTDGGYAGKKLKAALARMGKWTIQIVKRSDKATGLEEIPRRWVVERTFAWLSRNRRLAKDFERTIESATAWLFLASVQFLARRTATR